MTKRLIINVVTMSVVLGALACEKAELGMPSEVAVEALYSSSDLTARVTGNVIEITVDQPVRHVRRGGALWAKVGPYIYLFTEETEALFRAYPGLSGVRVITRTGRNGTEVARAFLHRETLNEITWRRSKNIAGKARTEGTRRPVMLEELVSWGQEHTEYEYSADFVS